MTFTSFDFIFYFVFVVTIYYLCPWRLRWFWLLLASCYFYMAFVPLYILILLGLIVIDYLMGRLIEKSTGNHRKIYFIVSIIANVGILFTFKYFNFFNENITFLANLVHWNYSISALRLILPLGLSFHTFQSLSYVIEVYRGKYPAERHIGIYALYVLFFPQLVAGPIERPSHLLPQLRGKVFLRWENVWSGLRLMAWGFFKKLVIADRLALSVDYVYGNINHVPGLSIFLTMIFFAIQLYTDFSGYSDIARGSARVLGINVMRNFDQPYFATSISEFWRRWHISLSSWFRDYVYFPLAFRKPTKVWLYFCVIITFLITGLWHGAGWTFVIMGGLHGVYIVSGLITKKWRLSIVKKTHLDKFPKLHSLMQQLLVFGLVSFSWIFFRSPNVATALSLIGRVLTGWDQSLFSTLSLLYTKPFETLGFSFYDLIIAVGGIIILLYIENQERRGPIGRKFENLSLVFRSFAYTGLALSLLIFGMYVTKQFIYFQF